MESQSIRDLFSTSEMNEHTNVTELKVILFGSKALAKILTEVHAKVLTDKSTAVACIKKFGLSRSQGCDSVIKEIWKWSFNFAMCFTNLPGRQNVEVDFECIGNMKYTLSRN